MNGSPRRNVNVLLVEDNVADANLVVEMLGSDEMGINVEVATDGEEALDLLHARQAHEAPPPNLILLDLNLPKKDGRDVLAELKRDMALRRIPVVVLTTSHSDLDIAQCYDLHANCYVTKPRGLAGLQRVLEGIRDFWLGTVKLPNER